MKHPEYKKLDVPRLHPQIKEMNGKSTRRLKQCIDALTDLLDREVPREDGEDCSVSDDNE